MLHRTRSRKRSKQREALEQRLQYQQRTYGRSGDTGQGKKQDLVHMDNSSVPVKRLARLLILIPIALIVGYFIYASPTAIIRIPDNARPTQEVDVYRASVQAAIERTLLNRSKVTFDYSGVSDELKQKHPEISSVGISFALFGDQPVVSLNFYEPSVIATSRGKDWIVDTRGVAVTELNTEQLQKRYQTTLRIRDDIGLIQKPGDALLTADDIRFIRHAKALFEEKGKEVEVTTLPNNPREVVFRLKSNSYGIRLSLDQDVRQQVGAALAAIDTLGGQIPQEYIDVRPGEKVYWR